MQLAISESRSRTRYNDISTVYAYFAEPMCVTECYYRINESFSCFTGDYRVGQEREFIESLDRANPGKYAEYRIGWSDSN